MDLFKWEVEYRMHEEVEEEEDEERKTKTVMEQLRNRRREEEADRRRTAAEVVFEIKFVSNFLICNQSRRKGVE